ncbi:xanthine dehydrogenase accessory factor [Caulobacter ginsengisoli]|uniref:Xanthine dehydrogenase accessory factor n=1 Tax=Caulobacter ginsengisoli TaxID=400775 RepID=A0ABU0IUZ5_9CAUL|nr:XdhC family protein [Caulobacter ginsengisoli]MDQ0464864.1 xanthine dehydrogenase accessory factor [Caulobacter ginsengisoli]
MDAPLPDWPMYGLSDDQRPALRAALAGGRAAVLATVAALGDGGPRPVGTQMVFAADGTVSGFMSGGCVEGDVALHARAVLADGAPRRLVYGEGSPWPDIRLLCGARIEILVERIAPDDPAAAMLFTLQEERRPAVWITDGLQRLCVPAGDAPKPWPGALTRRHDPVWRLAVVGGDPTALAIAALGVQAGFETTLIRPLGPETPPPIPGLAYSRAEPGQALTALDPWSAVAIAGHDLENDHAALLAALPSPAPYVGLLGARRRLPERLARLRAAGISERALEKLRAPIGLDLGGKAPWEVAVATIGEVVAMRHAQFEKA